MGKVLHASGSGYFPFCLTKGTPPETGLGTYYPISLSLTKYMSWWWKVKTWNLTGSSACIETADSGNLVNSWSTSSLVQDYAWTFSIESEENLVCQSGGRIAVSGFNANSTVNGSPALSTNSWFISFLNHAYIDGSTIYPRMYISGWYNTLSPGAPKVQAQLDPLSTFRIDGVLIPTYIEWFPSWASLADWSITGSQSFDLNPETYWDYS